MPDPTPEEHRQGAEFALAAAEELPIGSARRLDLLMRAQVHATLAASGPADDALVRAAALLRGAPPVEQTFAGVVDPETHAEALDVALSALTHPPTVRKRKAPAKPKPKPADVADALAAEFSQPGAE